MKMRVLLCVCALTAVLFSAGTASADQLDDVLKRGTLLCGTLGTSQPFSFQDKDTRTLVGHDVDICKYVADKLGVNIEYKLLSVASRIPELNGGHVDIVAANLGWSPARAEQIDFSHIYYNTAQKLLVRKDSGLTTPEQINGRRIAATKGSSSEREIKRIMDKSEVIGYGDSPSAYLALQQKKVDAQFASELVLVRLMMATPPTAPVAVVEKAVFMEPWGLGIRKNEPRFLKAVNDALEQCEKSGDAQKIFDKWLGAGSPFNMKRDYTIGPVQQ